MASPQGSHLRWWWPIHYVYIIFLYSFLLSPFLVFFKINENILLHFMLSFLISCTPLPHWVTKIFLGVVRFILMWHFRILKSIMETSCLFNFSWWNSTLSFYNFFFTDVYFWWIKDLYQHLFTSGMTSREYYVDTSNHIIVLFLLGRWCILNTPNSS